jgi:hypothetical protein
MACFRKQDKRRAVLAEQPAAGYGNYSGRKVTTTGRPGPSGDGRRGEGLRHPRATALAAAAVK